MPKYTVQVTKNSSPSMVVTGLLSIQANDLTDAINKANVLCPGCTYAYFDEVKSLTEDNEYLEKNVKDLLETSKASKKLVTSIKEKLETLKKPEYRDYAETHDTPNSSFISSLTYHYNDEVLDVKFVGGHNASEYNVTKELWRQFKAVIRDGGSVGRFYRFNIANRKKSTLFDHVAPTQVMYKSDNIVLGFDTPRSTMIQRVEFNSDKNKLRVIMSDGRIYDHDSSHNRYRDMLADYRTGGSVGKYYNRYIKKMY